YHRFNLPRRDITLHLKDVSVAPELALGAWAGFSDDPEHAMLMGDLVLTSAELSPVLSELTRRSIAVTAIHNHLVGEDPKLVYVQMVATDRAVATGDFAITGAKIAPLLQALAGHGITATALHTHMIGESPTIYFIHFWADGTLSDVVRGLKAAVDATK